MAGPAARVLRFGDFELDVRAGELRRRGIRIRFQDQSFQILLMLLDNPGEVVLRDEIRRKLWPNDTIVEFDHSINAAIRRLRNSLGESADEPRYIETLAKRGYRFVGQVDDERPRLAEEPTSTAEATTLAHYRLIDKLGSGAMGVVYRAEDLKLGRYVAVKFLPRETASDPEARRRFEREARAASTLNHPNVCSIYGFENFDGRDAIVMELVEGETLAVRLKQGPFALSQALTLAVQITDALDEAHRKGIAHRDLKPANIMLTKRSSSGEVAKILDFGIAKMEAPVRADAANPTEPGAILGTWNYMSPEQALGKNTDTRSDIYSFGVVLHEMLTGQRPKDGGPPSALPAAVERVLRRCLEQDREDRWQSARDLKAELRWVAEQPAAILPVTAPALPPRYHWRARLQWTAIGVAAALLIGVPAVLFRENSGDRAVTRFNIYPPETTRFGTIPTPMVSPDGRWIAIAINPSVGAAQLWLRALNTTNAVPLSGTEGVRFPFWSPDSKSIGFFANSKLKRIDLGGPSGAGPPLTLCDTATAPGGGTWSREGVIVFAAGALYRVRDTGGSPVVVTKADTSGPGSSYLYPRFLPDGRQFLFAAGKRGPTDQVTIRIGSLDSPENKTIREAGSHAIYSRGRLLFLQDSDLMAQPFDVRRLKLTGDPARLAGQIMPSPTIPGLGFFDATENGPLVYLTGADIPAFEIAWFDRKGSRLSTLGETTALSQHGLRISPDQKTVAVTAVEGGNTDVWLYDVTNGLRTRLTFDSSRDVSPVWSPDGRTIAFASNRKGHLDLYRRSVDGSGSEELLFADEYDKAPISWSPDGKFLLYERVLASATEIWVLPLTPEQAVGPLKAFSLFETANRKMNGQFSPDGRWVAFNESHESQDRQVYLAPFRLEDRPRTATRQVSRIAGNDPQWRKDGKEIFFKSGRALMSVDVDIREGSVHVGEQRQLFGPLMTIHAYAPSSDGQRFLFLLRNSKLTSQPVTVVENWTTLLKK
jgi:eukaryotic-like serine/threonine-protein kinase